MKSWWKHPMLWLTLLLSGAAVAFVLSSRPWTAERVADAWRREISEADDARAAALVAKLGDLGETAVPHLVQLLDDDREAIRHAAHGLLRDKFLAWLRDRSPADQRCLAVLAREFAAQPLPREAKGREWMKQAAMKLLRWPLESDQIDTAQMLLDCSSILQHLSDAAPPENALASADMNFPDAAFPDERPATARMREDLVEIAPETSEPLFASPPPQPPTDPEIAEAPPGDEISTSPPLSISDDPEAPPVLPQDGDERLIPPQRFVPETPRRFRGSEMHLEDEQPLASPDASSPDELVQKRPTILSPPEDAPNADIVDPEAIRKLSTRALIRHLHGLPAIARAADAELQNRGFDDKTLELAHKLDDADPKVRLELAEALPFATNLDAAAWLLELANDTDGRVRSSARKILATGRNPFTQRRMGNIERR